MLVAKKLCFAKPTRSSWPPKQGRKGDLSQLREDLEQKITTWQREVDLKLMKSVWGAHVRTPEGVDLSEECVCEPPGLCLCCHRPPEMVERDLLYAYQGLKDTTKGRTVGGGSPPGFYYSRGKQLTLRRGQGGQDQAIRPAGADAYKDLS